MAAMTPVQPALALPRILSLILVLILSNCCPNSCLYLVQKKRDATPLQKLFTKSLYPYLKNPMQLTPGEKKKIIKTSNKTEADFGRQSYQSNSPPEEQHIREFPVLCLRKHLNEYEYIRNNPNS
jgi:hypothetical protein